MDDRGMADEKGNFRFRISGQMNIKDLRIHACNQVCLPKMKIEYKNSF